MCKFERYGNCDEETKDQEYCIFHKPNKSEEEAREFYEKFLKKFKPKKEKIWYGLEEIPAEEGLVFEEAVDCRGYVFPEIPEDKIDFSFEASVFRGETSFRDATFEGKAWFKGATFKGEVRFDRATFEEEAWFENATFKGKVTFGRATFEKWACFAGAIFEGNASFYEATFEEEAWFYVATFEGDAEFEGATFEGIADFRFRRMPHKYKFCSKLVFLNTEFRKGVLIDIPSEWFKLPSAEAEACRVQRISYEREGRKDDADRMFVRERRALRKAEVEEAKANVSEVKGELKRLVASSPRKVERVKAELKAWFNLIKATSNYLLVKGRSSLEFFIADLTCEYGTNWKRPVISWIFLVFFIFPLLYFILGGITKVSSPLDYLYFSIVTATTLGYGDLQPIGWCRLIASTEAIFGTFMWAVFLVVFARKYMR